MAESKEVKCDCGVVVGVTRPKQVDYRVFWKDNGKDIEAKAYYTDNITDAVQTMFYMSKTYGANISGDEFTQRCIRSTGQQFFYGESKGVQVMKSKK
jgi:hypothetical protein